jgi:hypothetical protein
MEHILGPIEMCKDIKFLQVQTAGTACVNIKHSRATIRFTLE